VPGTAGRSGHRLRRGLLWAGAGALAVPVGTLLHELGHYSVGRAFSLPGPTLHYSSVSFIGEEQFLNAVRAGHLAAAAAMFPGWQVALDSAAGPIVSIVILWLAVLFTRREHLHPFVVALGSFSALRFNAPFLAGSVMMLRWFLRRQGFPAANVDEINAALSAGISPGLAVTAVLIIVFLGVFKLLERLPGNGRLASLVWLAAGIAAGSAAYFLYLGPLLLP
jgi:hypothetical protein